MTTSLFSAHPGLKTRESWTVVLEGSFAIISFTAPFCRCENWGPPHERVYQRHTRARRGHRYPYLFPKSLIDPRQGFAVLGLCCNADMPLRDAERYVGYLHLYEAITGFMLLNSCVGREGRERNSSCVFFVISPPPLFCCFAIGSNPTLFYLRFLLSHQLENQVTTPFGNV